MKVVQAPYRIPYSHTDERITPEKAAKFLSTNVANRNVYRSNMDRIKSAMESGAFLQNGETIKFDWNGNLIDGQHRLLQIVETGITQTILVVRGLDPIVKPTVDTGRPKNNADNLAMSGVANANNVAAALRWKLTVEGGYSSYHNGRITNTVIVKEFEKHPSIANCVRHNAVSRNILNGSIQTYLNFTFRNIDIDEADRFFGDLDSGANMEEGDPVLVLRNWLTSALMRRDSIRAEEKLARTINAWNARRMGRKVVRHLKGRTKNARDELIYPKPI